MNSVGLGGGVRNATFGQQAQRNQAVISPREKELWGQIIDLGSQSDEVAENADIAYKNAAAEQETQTKIFVNAQGERVLAIKSAFGVKYLKIGEATDPMFTNTNANTETPSQNQSMQQVAGQYMQMLSTELN
ncbi:MAG: hypothetical protein FWE34_08930 [Defluviitaleaceae bacterium]|nr:hypothetical protein [Defluviitaleaceae bacterium]